jgi:hypothetical protein
MLYEPLNEYKPLGPDIGIVDGPLEYLTMAGVRLPLPFSTRMTVLRLKNGDLFLHSPIAFEATLTGRLNAVTWASPAVRARARARGDSVQFTRDLGAQAPDEWRDETEQTVVPGGIFGEIVFFHKLSKTIILADTILNLELDRLRQPWRFATWLSGMYYPNGQLFFGMRLPLLLQRRKTLPLASYAKVDVLTPFDKLVTAWGWKPSGTGTWAGKAR